MYTQYGLSLNIENIYALAVPYLVDGETIAKMSDLKAPYIRFLKAVHPSFPISSKETLVREPERIEAFTAAFSSSKIDDLQQEKMVGQTYDPKRFNENANLLLLALSELRRCNHELGELFDVAIHAIILCGSSRNQEGFRAHGGSSNKCIGLIWLNLDPKMPIRDVVEMLIHELTHTLVFLDELNRGHFNYENIAKEKFWAISSILKRKRPMDKVVHSVLVSLELLWARKNYLPSVDESKLIHPESSALLKNIEHSINSVLDHPLLKDVCKDRAVTLMRNAQTQLKSHRERSKNEIAI